MKRSITICLAVAGVFIAKAAEAHTYGATGGGFPQGFLHPMGGLDHLLAMIAVGLWAAQVGGKALWRIPACFVAVMAVGGLAATSGVALPMVELGVVGSLIVLGSLVAFAANIPVRLGMAVVGLFAVFHGYAHGTEIPQAGSALLYSAGFLSATALLHLSGITAGLLGREGLPARLVRLGGAGTAAVGLYLLTAFFF